jgi:hypothetical protein
LESNEDCLEQRDAEFFFPGFFGLGEARWPQPGHENFIPS